MNPRPVSSLQFRIGIIVILIYALNVKCNSRPEFKTIGSIERIDPALDQIISKDAQPEIIAEGFEWSEGPLWLEDKKMLLFSDIPPNIIYKWTEKDGKQVYLTPSGYTGQEKRGGEVGSNGLLLNRKGQLVLCQHGDRRIAVMDAGLEAPAPSYVTLADNYSGKKLNSPNDAVIRSNGEIYFTDPPYGLEKNMDDPKKEIPFQGVYKIGTNGELKLLTDTITRPNGIGFLPGETTLLVANSDPEKAIWYAFDISGDSLTNARIFYDATAAGKKDKGSPDGLKADKNGNVFATGPGGVWIFDKNAKLLGKIRIPESTSNVALANDEKTLYITADMYVLRVNLR
jgi:gluconolactonase